MVRKISTVLLAAALLMVSAGVFAGGEGESGSTGEAGPAISKITSYLDRILIEDDGLAQFLAAYKDQTGITLEVIKPPHNQYAEVLGAAVMAGDLPDIMELWDTQYTAYVDSNLLVPLDEFIAANPNMASVTKDYYEVYRAKDGKIYGFPTYKGGGCVTYVRQDWLDNLGMDVPETWNEYVAMLRAFTFDDPDGDGQDNTIGLTLPFQVPASEFDYYNRPIMQDAYFGFQYVNGQWVDGFSQPAMRQALRRWIDLYAAGVIDREFFTNNTSRARSKLMEGQAGAFDYWTGTWATRLDQSAKNINPAADISAVNAIDEAHYINRVGPLLAISTAAQNPKAVFDNIIGHMWDKGDGQVLWTYGIQGLHWDLDDAGNPYMLPQPSNPERPFNKTYIDPYLPLNDFEPMIPQQPKERLSIEIHNEDSVSLRLVQGGDVYTKNIGDLNTAKQELFAQIVTGEITIDQGLAEYQRRANALQISTILAELNS
ncbi:extracellular solute-binding protein [Spirochaeta lutea]|uniref:ABC transporter substrate-binding protein n=1 Tax=Spirochaeta lutea TaxID=1480694 RepID=A0A098QXY9_9SPIO|nr:extracellular solute-binding protein [Spirochaeta lutea]KGE72765.1 ABC transporter substrate-binding protein [Spirochaeta lutea]